MALNHGWTYRHQVSPAGAGVPIAAYLSVTYPHTSHRGWMLRIEAGEVDVDGVPGRVTALLRPGQIIGWRRPPWDEPDVPLSFVVVYEDDWLLAVEKPSGLPTMPAGGFLEHTLQAIVRRRDPGASPLHRLGRHTSGLVLFARHPRAAAGLSRGWRTVRKHYRALGTGAANWGACEINVPIGPVSHERLGTVFAASPVGRPSHSLATVIERRAGATLFEVEILTGRPHQVRIHLAWAGHPLVGDPLYGAGGRPVPDGAGLPGDGGYLLHATRLAFDHPITGDAITIASTPPAELKGARE